MIHQVAQFIKNEYPSFKKIGVLSTAGTSISNVYQDGLAQFGLTELKVSSEIQNSTIDPAIYSKTYGVKAFSNPVTEQAKNDLSSGIAHLINNGAEAVIDFVGERGSTSMGLDMTGGGGYYYIVGYGEEIKILAVDVIISEKNIIGNLVGTWSELYELMELANKGYVKLSMEEYKLENANKALHDLNEGLVKGRAVLIP